MLCFEDIIGNTTNLDPGRILGTYLWSIGDTTQTISISERGAYSVVLTDQFGCFRTDVVNVFVDCQANAWIPNGFTPDNNGHNETWGVSGRGIESVEMYVYNRWGELIWESTSVNDRWDGTHKGILVQQDVYDWILTYTFLDAQKGERTRSQSGAVTVLR